jgi:pimeloyl-ACP methyl ester carboxylesterase
MTQENGDAASEAPARFHWFSRKDEYVPAEQAEHRLLPWHLGRWLVLQQGDPSATGLDTPEEDIACVIRTLGRVESPAHNAEGVAWRSKPTWYIVAINDRTVHPDLERFVANRMGATTYDLDSSHVPMLSNPGLVLDVIREAAGAVQELAAAVV